MTSHNHTHNPNLPFLPSISRLSPSIIRILGHNPGKYTLQGTNTYLIGTGQKRILIDTGSGEVQWLEDLRRVLSREWEGSEYEEQKGGSWKTRCDDAGDGIEIQDIILTHRHSDHVGGVEDVVQLFPGVRIWKYLGLTTGGLEIEDEQEDEIELPLDLQERKKKKKKGKDMSQRKKYHHIRNGQVFIVPGARLRAIHTPGHTDDSIILFFDNESAALSPLPVPEKEKEKIRGQFMNSSDEVYTGIIRAPRRDDEEGVNRDFIPSGSTPPKPNNDEELPQREGGRQLDNQKEEKTQLHHEGPRDDGEDEGWKEEGIFTGDTILGHGTAVFEDLKEYMSSLELIQEIFPSRSLSLDHHPRRGRLLPGRQGPSSSGTTHAESAQSTNHREGIREGIEDAGDGCSTDNHSQKTNKKVHENGDGEIQHDDDRMKGRVKIRIYPGHGSHIENGLEKVEEYITHRNMREEQILNLLVLSKTASSVSSPPGHGKQHPPLVTGSGDGDGHRLGDAEDDDDDDAQDGKINEIIKKQQPSMMKEEDQRGKTAREIVEVIYKDVSKGLWDAAERGVLLILEKLREDGKVVFVVSSDDDLEVNDDNDDDGDGGDGEDGDDRLVQTETQKRRRQRQRRWIMK